MIEQPLPPSSMPEQFRRQADACDRLGSPFTAGLLTRAAEWLGGSSPIAVRLCRWPGEGANDAVPLRFAGAIHALALSRRVPRLERVYEGLGHGDCPDFADVWPVVTEAVEGNAGYVDRFLDNPPQTNEVGRAAVLMAAAHELAARYEYPFDLLEAGGSAGLNLAFDKYHYHLGGLKAGPEEGRPTLRPEWIDASPPPANVLVADRTGCDAAPLDLNSEKDRLRLGAYVWPDQVQRIARLNAAVETARLSGVTMERATIGNWLEHRLPLARPKRLTLLFHTIVWQYLPAYEVALAEARIREAGARATDEAPFARLAMEWNPVISCAEVRLTTWPDGKERLLGFSHAHGDWIEWKGWI